MMKACKHLDHTPGKYGPVIELVELSEFPVPVKFWKRGPTWTDNGPGEEPNPSQVQFCGQGRGRIDGIFQCYNPGELHCYEVDPLIVTGEPKP